MKRKHDSNGAEIKGSTKKAAIGKDSKVRDNFRTNLFEGAVLKGYRSEYVKSAPYVKLQLLRIVGSQAIDMSAGTNMPSSPNSSTTSCYEMFARKSSKMCTLRQKRRISTKFINPAIWPTCLVSQNLLSNFSHPSSPSAIRSTRQTSEHGFQKSPVLVH